MPLQLLFLSFILVIFILLILLALDIDYLSRLFSREELPFNKISSHREVVEDINRQININVQLKNVVEKIIQLCPVNAITKSNKSQEGIIISETLCLGHSCRECLRFALLARFDTETRE